MELIPKYLHEWAEKRQAGCVLTDYYLARRKRIHLGYIPHTGAQYESVDMDEVLAWLVEQGCDKALFVGGQPKRPRIHYITRLRPTDWRDFQ